MFLGIFCLQTCDRDCRSLAVRAVADYSAPYYNLACLCSLQQDIEACVENLERAIKLNGSVKEIWPTDEDMEWARQDERVRNLLGLD